MMPEGKPDSQEGVLTLGRGEMTLEQVKNLTYRPEPPAVKVSGVYTHSALFDHEKNGNLSRYKLEFRPAAIGERILGGSGTIYTVTHITLSQEPYLVIVGEIDQFEQIYGIPEKDFEIPKGWEKVELRIPILDEYFITKKDRFIVLCNNDMNKKRLVVRRKMKIAYFKVERHPRLPKKGEWYISKNGVGNIQWYKAHQDFTATECICAEPVYEQDCS